jgi:alpha-galactosidase
MKDIHNKALMDEKKAEFHRYVSAWREFSPISESVEEVQEVETVEPVKVIEEDKSMTESNVVEVIKPEEAVVELVKEEPVVEASSYEYHEMHITSNYISVGINMDEMNAFAEIVKGKRVKVIFEVTEV